MAVARPNPFKFGDPVEGEYYYPRPELTQSVRQFLENRIHVILIGPRRFGKTSFILNLLHTLEGKGTTCFFVDIFNVTSHRDFLQQILRALRAKKKWVQRLKEWFTSIPRLRPKISWESDESGETTFSLTPEFSPEKDSKEMIQDTIAALGSLDKRVIVAIDEFQTIAELEDQGWLEATLRTQMQQLKNVSFLFSGSRKSIIQDMLNNPSRPFYRSCQPVEFPPLDEKFSEWIVERFKLASVECELEAVKDLRTMVQDTPNYVQMTCYHLVAQGVQRVDRKTIREALPTIVKQNSYAYQTLLNSLTPLQQRVLRLAAIESEGIFSKELISRYELSSGPAVASAVKSLKQKQILDEGTAKGKVYFDDPLFAIWLKTEFDPLEKT